MPKNNNNQEYDILLNTHNRLVARFHDLQNTLADKEQVWATIENGFLTNERKMRSFCEKIIAKIPSDEFLGKAFSYDQFSTEELIDKAIDAYEEYNTRRTALMKRIHEESMARGAENENLKTQIAMLKQNGAASLPAQSTVNPDTGEVQDNDAGMAPKPNQSAESGRDQGSGSNLPKGITYNVQEAAKKGELDVIVMTEEDSDVSLEDIQQLADAAAIKTAAQIQDSGIKISPSQKRLNEVRKIEQAATNTVMISKAEVLKNLNDKSMEMLKIVGRTGVSDTDSLKAIILEQAADQKTKIAKSSLSYTYNALINNQVLATEIIAHPLKKQFQIFWLTEIGGVIYKDATGEMPVQAHCLQVRKDHDNFEHGYGILSLRDIVEEKGNFKSVSCDRKDNTITLKDGITYMPDVTAVGKFKAYFEYELDNHNQSNFNIKLNKMASVTRFLNIVVPNRDAIKSITPKIETWIKSRGGLGCLPGYKVRLSSLTALANIKGDINSNTSWTTIFDLGANSKAKEEKEDKTNGHNIPGRVV